MLSHLSEITQPGRGRVGIEPRPVVLQSTRSLPWLGLPARPWRTEMPQPEGPLGKDQEARFD